ncbi:hypothetical protein M9Y10_014656 [Tritrichomonas musculus]|uniref:Glycosyl hydrolase family 13 catalytic domain-containing protein n=1 Tax=Tritrichomonas musculus TaxID=1915356 RepID=A0ABR2L045_9EUKA
MSSEEEEAPLVPKEGIFKLTIGSMNTLFFTVAANTEINQSKIQIIDSDGQNIAIKSLSMPDNDTKHFTITLENNVDLTKTYYVNIQDVGSKVAIPYEVYDCDEFVKNFTYDGNDLGATITDKGTMFKIWAPTAGSVILQLFKSGDGTQPFRSIAMQRGDKGVWSSEVDGVGHGTYYVYIVKTALGDQTVVDPYAKSAGVNGRRGMVLDQNKAKPDGFENEKYRELHSYREAIVWETHVRDFSVEIKSSKYKGKFLSFTETGLKNDDGIPVGVDYLKELGITHVQLMPIYDFGSVNERKDGEYNWGYDPQNYNVPEGSFSTNPADGSCRVIECKRMIQALHSQGFSVVMDVVYNHTHKLNSNLNKCVPFYYYRYNDDNTPSNGSGCGNDVMSERVMCSKYIVDSLHYWMTTYKLDGFRFDLMGLLDVNTMQKVEADLHSFNPSAIIYGEGWQMGTATHVPLANQVNISQVNISNNGAGSISVFNDDIRDGIRGSVFNKDKPGYTGDPGNGEFIGKVIFGLKGSEVSDDQNHWRVKNASSINYISAHDNSTLYDKLKTSCQGASEDDILKMNRMGAAIVMLCKGTPFMLGGEEMLRSKPNKDGTYNDNSFKAGDEINTLKWNSLTKDSNEYKTFLYYKGLIEMRKGSKVLTSLDENVDVQCNSNCLIATFSDKDDQKVVAVINANKNNFGFHLPDGKWSLIANGETAGTNEISEASGDVNIDPQSVFVYRTKGAN